MTALAGALQRRAAAESLPPGDEDAAANSGRVSAAGGGTSSTSSTGSGRVVTVNDFVFDCQLGSVNLLTLLHWVKVGKPSAAPSSALGQRSWGSLFSPPVSLGAAK